MAHADAPRPTIHIGDCNVSLIQDKANELCSIEGESFEGLCAICTCDSVNPGICMNEGCSYSTEVEPDQTQGYCEECETQTVKSFSELVLEGAT